MSGVPKAGGNETNRQADADQQVKRILGVIGFIANTDIQML